MSATPISPTFEARRAQAFPVLAAEEIARMHRFGKPRRFAVESGGTTVSQSSAPGRAARTAPTQPPITQ